MNPANPSRPAGCSGLAALTLALALALVAGGPVAAATDDISAAEQALFLDPHLAGLRAPASLRYAYHKTGTLEPAFDDQVALALKASADGHCCEASVRFFSGKRALQPPPVESARGNPVILHFLEHDIHEMERLTHGKASYFRKRIRMAVFEGASMRDLTLPFRGHPVTVREISITPYLDDPNRSRFEKLANKEYRFLLASGVPGGLYGIRTRVPGDSPDAPPLLDEELLVDGARNVPVTHQP